MEINYYWLINQMTVKNKIGNLSNIVIEIYWTRKAVLIDGEKTYTSTFDSFTNFSNASQDNFTSYENLTFEQVCKWLENANNIFAIDESLKNKLDLECSVIVTNLNFPWINK